MKIPIELRHIQGDLSALDQQAYSASFHYASLLRIVLTPSRYEITEDALEAALSALRRSEGNPSYLLVVKLLSELAPLGRD